jgi:peroxiredoxin
MKRKYLAIYFLAIFTFIGISINATIRNTDGYEIGSLADDFSLKNVDGTTISLSDYDDAKGFIVTFTCNHCPYAQMYEQRIIDLHDKYAPKGYPVIAINPNDPKVQPQDSFEQMVKRAEEKNYPFPYVMDETQEIAKVYGATRTPHIYVLNKEEKGLVVRYIGAIDNNYKDASEVSEKYVEDAIDALMAGEEVETQETKAIGCTIKWSKA